MTDSNTELQAELEVRKEAALTAGKESARGIASSIDAALRDALGEHNSEVTPPKPFATGGVVTAEVTPPKFMQPSFRPKLDTHARLAPLVESLSSRTTAKSVSDKLSEIADAKTKTYRAIADIDEQMTKLFDERNKLLADADDLSRSEAILVAANNEANSPRWQR